MPGLIDCHVHFPQIDMIAAYGEQLLDWLEQIRSRRAGISRDSAHAEDAAEFS
ncbi:MAG: amidohydrolase family protein [Woeseiaceae bacterium]|nr:amidohydrolase family protein [Woeseiaceae bacterium]